MPNPIRITSLRDLDAVISVLGLKDWRVSAVDYHLQNKWCDIRYIREGAEGGRSPVPDECWAYAKWPTRHECPAYTTDPAAAYALRQRMEDMGWQWTAAGGFIGGVVDGSRTYAVLLTKEGSGMPLYGEHRIEHVAFALAAAHALGLELEFVAGWDGAK